MDQLPIPRIHVSLYGLKPAGPIAVRDGRNRLAVLWFDLVGHHHEGRWISRLEILAYPFCQNRRAERPEWLPIFDAAVKNLFHILAAWVGQNASVPQRAWPKLHPTLEPAYNFAFGDRLRRPVNQILFTKFAILASGALEVLKNLTVPIFRTVVDVPHFKAPWQLQLLMLHV